jgi:CRISPR-associated exonuclease Cas4
MKFYMSEAEINFDSLKVSGIKLNYYLVCKRKLWLFDRKITMENTSEKVLMGKILHEDSYQNQSNKEVLIDNLISIDIIDNLNIREVKSSNKMEEADKIQIYYYLYYLKTLGINRKGIINYPKQRKREFIELTPEAEQEVENSLLGIKNVLALEKPPLTIDKPYCKKCAYYEFCYG